MNIEGQVFYLLIQALL
uniref:Uncharacterized protein n=1 Tax=Anguilla anguilla TaxID=7936 RepID=A0A0E9TSQ8_ANGAN